MKTKLKVINIITRLNVGGPARQVIALSKKLKELHIDDYLIAGKTSNYEIDMSYLAKEFSVPYIYLPSLQRKISPFYDLLCILELFLFFIKIKPDVIHTHTAKAGFVGRIAALFYVLSTPSIFVGKKRKCLIIHTFHGNVLNEYFGSVKSLLFVYIEKILARLITDKIIVLSIQQFKQLNEYFRIGQKQQYSVVPVYLNVADFKFSVKSRNTIRTQIGITEPEIVIGFVGRLTEVKNPDLFVEIAVRCLQAPKFSSKNLRFLIIGDGELRPKLERYVEGSNLQDKIHFIGSQRNITKYYSAMDIVCLTSVNEGTPLVLLEAMAAERPIIASNVGGVADMLGEKTEIGSQSLDFDIRERGITVKTNNHKSFTEAIHHLINNESIKDLVCRNSFNYTMFSHSDLYIKQIYN